MQCVGANATTLRVCWAPAGPALCQLRVSQLVSSSLVQVGKDIELDAVGLQFDPYPYRLLRLHRCCIRGFWLSQALLVLLSSIYHDQIDIMEQAATNILMRIFI